jgi:hypothetical protein
MSLKTLHIVFITAAILLVLGFAAWSFHNYSISKAKGDLFWGILSAVSTIGLVWYGKYFLKKLKNISYL